MTVRKVFLSQKLSESGGRPSGFDYLRLGLAVTVVCMHSVITSYGRAADIALWASPLRGPIRMILPMFFALSGYLVAGSLLRTTLVQFLGLRFIRIYPALAVEVLLSALLLGPLLTTVPLVKYFQSKLFFSYLINVTGDIHFLLPGVFAENPFPDIVNAQLWTVPFELLCYVSIAALTIIGVKRWNILAPVAAIGLSVIYFIGKLILSHGNLPFIEGGVPGALLVASFLFGASIFLYGHRLPWSPALCVASALIAAILVGLVRDGVYFAAPFAAYFTVAIGLTNPKKLAILRGADYSYGIFLYGFVIQQTVVFVFPWARVWWINVMICVPAAAAFAAVSWHYVERPALALKKYLPVRLRPPWEPPSTPPPPSKILVR